MVTTREAGHEVKDEKTETNGNLSSVCSKGEEIDLHSFVQNAHHSRMLAGEADKDCAQTYQKLEATWRLHTAWNES